MLHAPRKVGDPDASLSAFHADGLGSEPAGRRACIDLERSPGSDAPQRASARTCSRRSTPCCNRCFPGHTEGRCAPDGGTERSSEGGKSPRLHGSCRRGLDLHANRSHSLHGLASAWWAEVRGGLRNRYPGPPWSFSTATLSYRTTAQMSGNRAEACAALGITKGCLQRIVAVWSARSHGYVADVSREVVRSLLL